MSVDAERQSKLVATSVALSAEQIEQLALLAARRGRSRSFVVRRAVERELSRAARARRGRADP